MIIIESIIDCLCVVVSDTPIDEDSPNQALLDSYSEQIFGIFNRTPFVYIKHLSEKENKIRDLIVDSFHESHFEGDENMKRIGQIDRFRSLTKEELTLLFPGIGKSFHSYIGQSPTALDE